MGIVRSSITAQCTDPRPKNRETRKQT